MTASPPERLRIRVEGVVQGVGFRPHVYRLARSLQLGGFVQNDAGGVFVEVEGAAAAVRRFLERLRDEAPPLASVERLASEPVGTRGEREFRIIESDVSGRPSALVSPDTATCPECVAELFDPEDRRHRYPFINCTNCGPRFTIVRGIPYDRPLTTMAGFEMCDRCRAEYEDPLDRRFHAQPNACPACGPRARLLRPDGSELGRAGVREGVEPGDRDAVEPGDRDAVEGAARALVARAIVAVKGLGGYHLACVADDEEAVATLRARKHREDKPFALMVPDLAAARALARLGPEEERLLMSRERPIVLAPRREGRERLDRDGRERRERGERRGREGRGAGGVAPSVAPGHRDLGLMLPYSPLHHLLLADAGRALVMTSGNVSDEPIAYRDDEALERLAGIADLFLVHDRPIETRTDDSVVRVVSIGGERRPLLLRRSRGHVPAPEPLPIRTERPLLACGAHLKNSFTVARGARAWVGHHIGDLESWETLRSFREGIAHFERIFEVEPEVLAHDLHPDYLSTRYAVERASAGGAGAGAGAIGTGADSAGAGADVPEGPGGPVLVGIQHHHAHLAACLAEHGETGPALGAIFDGTGYGTDGTVWGGELLLGDLADFERVGHLWPVRMPGGEAAVREPWRMALSWLLEAGEPEPGTPGAGAPEPGTPGAGAPGGEALPERPRALAHVVDEESWQAVGRLLRSGLRSPVTTSVGRLFDAVSALCGIRARVNYEGQAAIELEMAAARAGDEGAVAAYAIPLLSPEEARTVSYTGPAARPASDPGCAARTVLDARPVVRAVLDDLKRGTSVPSVAARFHESLARATARACVAEARRAGVETVVLSGGVFQNLRLLERTAGLLAASGLRPLVPRRLPPNDGGISFGQAAAAAARASRRTS